MARYDVALSYGHGENTYENGGGKGVKVGGKVYEEHHFNADVGEQVRKILEAHGLRVLVVQPPRGKDVSLTTRTNKANAENVKLYWSIHANAATPSAHGYSAFYWHTSQEGKELAREFMKNVRDAGYDQYSTGAIASKKGSWTNFHEVRETKMVAVLTENGFMTNSGDFEDIFGKNSKASRKRLAEVHAKTILEYFGKKYNGSKTPVKEVAKPADKPAPASSEKLYGAKFIDSGSEVKSIQNKLIKLGYKLPKYGADGYWGDETESAVRQFQKDQGLGVDGIVGKNTMAKLNSAKPKSSGSLKYDGKLYGDKFHKSGSQLKAIQKALIKAGYKLPRYGADGQWGDETESAVRKFQRDHGLGVDGIVGKNTINALNKAV